MNRRLFPLLAAGVLAAPALAGAQERPQDGGHAPAAARPAPAPRAAPSRPAQASPGRGGFSGYRAYENAFPGGVRGGGERGDHGPNVAPGSGGYRSGAQLSGPPVAPGSGGYRSGAGRGYGGPAIAPGSGGYRSGAQPSGPPVAPGSGGYRSGAGGYGGPAVAPGSGGYRAGAGRGYGGAPAAPGSGGYRGDGRGGYGGYGSYGGGYGGRGGDYGARGTGYGGGGYGWRGGGGGTWSYHGRSYPRFRGPAFSFPRGYSYRRYAVGAYLPRVFLYDSFFLNDWNAYYLTAPPGPDYRWVRYGPDAVLVELDTGEVVDVAYGVFDDGSAAASSEAYDGDGYDAPSGGEGYAPGPPEGGYAQPGYLQPGYPQAGYGEDDGDAYGPPPR